jgi:hypothetical protein
MASRKMLRWRVKIRQRAAFAVAAADVGQTRSAASVGDELNVARNKLMVSGGALFIRVSRRRSAFSGTNL